MYFFQTYAKMSVLKSIQSDEILV